MRKMTLLIIALFILLVALTGCTTKEKDNFYTTPEGKQYKYKLELTGTMPNAVNETTFNILTNDKTLTFEKFTKSLFSSHSKDHEGIEYYILSNE